MIKTVFIDIDDTLLDFDECSKNAIKIACKKYNINYTEEIFSTFKSINRLLWLEIEKGTLTKDKLHKIRWKLIFDELKISTDGYLFEKEFFSNLSNSAKPIDGAREILEYLSLKYTVCATTNASFDQQVKRLKICGMYEYIKHIFASEKVGFQKPSPKFFDCCFEMLDDTLKSEVIIIGDSISADITGGVEYGIKSCWLNRRKEKIPEGLKIDYIVENLYEIKNIL